MNEERRPDPDALLERVREEELRSKRGKLKIFFGANAGVGKTYAMLEAAQRHLAEGRDVVIGWIETHGRQETAALLGGLPSLPARRYVYRDAQLSEFDLDAALARRPSLLVLDELAHTNATGARHAKRWQDVEELREAGIDVYTTLNVQHIESLNDVVTQITGVAVRETVPDAVLEQADEVELVDLPPDDLLQRLQEGKVYLPDQAQRAVRSFFRKGNLIALRELALRRTAERVDEQMRSYRRDHGIARTWPAAERLLVCVGPNPASVRLIRATRRMAAGLRAEWVALYVETPLHGRLPESDRQSLDANLRLVEQLGGNTAILSGHDVSAEVLAYARDHNVTKIVAGKPTHPRWRDRIKGSLVDELVRGSGDIDVYILSGDVDEEERAVPLRPRAGARPSAYLPAALVVALCTLISWGMFPFFAASNLVLVYILGVAFVATRYERGPAVIASFLSVACFDFFFVPPYMTFAVTDTQYVLTFAIMLVVALLVSNLASRVREQTESARQRERRTAILYALSRDLAAIRGSESIAQASARHAADVMSTPAAVLLPRPDGRLIPMTAEGSAFTLEPRDEGVARWVLEHGRMAGLGTDTLPGAGALFLPVTGTQRPVAVLGVRPTGPQGFSPDQVHILEALASQTAAALERARLADEAQQALVDVETERLRNALLSSVSHDLRTPLAAITGAASSLLDDAEAVGPDARRELTATIFEEADRLNRLVRNLLDMTRLQSGTVRVARQWHPLEEIVGSALNRLEARLQGRPVVTRIGEDLPLVPLDGVLIEQVLVNLIENALKYTPGGTPVEISAWGAEGEVTIEVADRGPGVPPGEEERVFEKFHRIETRERPGGVGLGLTVCRGIVAAHGGRIWVENRPGGGAAFRFTLPLIGTPPSVVAERAEGAR
jgi:two-component system, OmpR family, sensor histidine kinase KdpD